ncbi:MAG: hypothetical protein AVDCRST_MAG88-2518, partial [uncultured Thermomicrobiales bacterium]
MRDAARQNDVGTWPALEGLVASEAGDLTLQHVDRLVLV